MNVLKEQHTSSRIRIRQQKQINAMHTNSTSIFLWFNCSISIVAKTNKEYFYGKSIAHNSDKPQNQTTASQTNSDEQNASKNCKHHQPTTSNINKQHQATPKSIEQQQAATSINKQLE